MPRAGVRDSAYGPGKDHDFVAVEGSSAQRKPQTAFLPLLYELEPRGTRPMPWIQLERDPPKGPKGGVRPTQERIRCDKCDWETNKEYWAYNDSREEAGAWWPTAEENQGQDGHAWCPECASRESYRAKQSYQSTDLNIEAVMSAYWRAPNGGAVVPGNTVAKAHPGRVPPKASPPGLSSSSLSTEDRLAALEADVANHPGRVPPKAPPPGLSSSSPSTEQRLAALEADVANLRLSVAGLEERLRVAGLEERSSGAASSSGLARPGAWSQGWAWSQDWARGRD